MAYASTRDIDGSRVLRLGLRSRLRAARKGRMASEYSRRRLAKDLENAVARDPDGVRLARALLVDGLGPLYAPAEPGDLYAAALRALRALDGHGSGR